jgi:hypothetical protein
VILQVEAIWAEIPALGPKSVVRSKVEMSVTFGVMVNSSRLECIGRFNTEISLTFREPI